MGRGREGGQPEENMSALGARAVSVEHTVLISESSGVIDRCLSPTSPHQSLIERGSRGAFILDHLHLSAARSEKALGPEGDFRPSHGGQWPGWQVEQSTWGISSVPRPPPSLR